MKRLHALTLILITSMVFPGCKVVEDGTAGVSKSFGDISEEPLGPGMYLSVPVAREIEVWNTKTQRLFREIDIPSREGLIVTVETTVLFRPTNVVQLRKKVGPLYVQQVLVSTLNDSFREKIGKQRVDDLIQNQEKVTDEIHEDLRAKMEKRGIVIEELLVTGLQLPQKFKEAIERKLEQEQKALQKQFELDQAKKDAEIEVARAEGAAKAQEIVRRTLSPEYLHYLWISTLNRNPNVIYVATEANMPVFRTAPQPQAKSIPKSGGGSSSAVPQMPPTTGGK